MTNNPEFQKELKEKVKPGIKPSDLKKGGKKHGQKDILPTPIVQDDEGYESEEEKNIPTIPTKKEKELQTQINSLQRQLQTYKDFKEADLKIKEKYKEEIKELKSSLNKSEQQKLSYQENLSNLEAKIEKQYKTIEGLQNQVKNTEETKPTTSKTFFCDSCQLTKQGIYIKRKVDAPFEPRLHGRICYLCSSCSPYVKELSEPNFDKDNNPYKIY